MSSSSSSGTPLGYSGNDATTVTESRDSDLEQSYSHALDWNNSIGSLGGGENNNNSDAAAAYGGGSSLMETLQEDENDNDDNMMMTTSYKGSSTPKNPAAADTTTMIDKAQHRHILAKAEKLKKQGNAKFNKGDFAAARTLYTEGITVMSAVHATLIQSEECELLSNMHSNRSVTWFREKKFDKCVHDCDKAIRYDPLYDKSWIRKWRALMALGEFDAAYACLETASTTIPDSKRVQEELSKLQGDKQLLHQARACLEQDEFGQARELLKPYSRTSDNIGLLFVAARADAGLGLSESALEKINRALRFNPTHAEGLELRGHVLFLAGETEKAAHLLQEVFTRNKNNKRVKLELSRCQKTHSALIKGRSCVKRGRYIEAIDYFSVAIKESCNHLPNKAPLFGMLRAERAEALLLSKKYKEAMQDAQDVLQGQPEHATAWSVKAEILMALGQTNQAKRELQVVRNTPWGADNPTIDDAYRRVDFELRVLKADEELLGLVDQLERGDRELRHQIFGSSGGSGRGDDHSSSRGRNKQQQQRPRMEKRRSAGPDNNNSNADFYYFDDNSAQQVKQRSSKRAGGAAADKSMERKRHPSVGPTSGRRGGNNSSRRRYSVNGGNGEGRSRSRPRSRDNLSNRPRTAARGDCSKDDERTFATYVLPTTGTDNNNSCYVPPPSIHDLTNGESGAGLVMDLEDPVSAVRNKSSRRSNISRAGSERHLDNRRQPYNKKSQHSLKRS